MFARLGVDSRIFYHGWRVMNVSLRDERRTSSISAALGWAKRLVKSVRWRTLLRCLREFDLIVVVGHSPVAYMRYFFNDEEIRSAIPRTPIVLYDLVYLPTRGDWGRALREGSPSLGIASGGHFGVERYDWHLCASVVSEWPMPSWPQPCSLIGVDLNDGSLFPEQHGQFLALLDFERPEHSSERNVQRAALQETNTAFIELKGRYTTKAIREIYRRCAIYFIAHRESFGLPICETQACGNYVFTPFGEWCPSHWQKEDLLVAGPGRLTENFVVYNNNVSTLVDRINRIRESYDPWCVRRCLLENQPNLYLGDLDELNAFVQMVRSGRINGGLHSKERMAS